MAHKQVTHADVDDWFTYKAPTPDQVERMNEVRSYAKAMAHQMVDSIPDGPSKTKAIQDLRETVMRGNLGIMFEGEYDGRRYEEVPNPD